MNLIEALAAPNRARREVQKIMSPSQPLGGLTVTGNTSVSISQPDPYRAIAEGYKSSVWVFACVFRLAMAASSIPWRVDRRVGEDDWEPDPSDWRAKLLAYPNNKLSTKEMIFWTVAWLALNGNGILRKVSGGMRGVIELWPLSPRNMRPIPSNEEWISGYEVIENGQRKRWSAEEIIHARLPDPLDPLWGTGMLKPAWNAVLADGAASKWTADLYERGGVPPGAMVDEAATTPELLQEAAQALKTAWRLAGKNQSPMVVGSADNWIPFAFNASDMQLIDQREYTVKEIITSFGMLPAMFDSSASTYDNMRTAVRWMYDQGVLPLMDTLRDAFNLGLLTEEERQRDDIWITYDLTSVPFFRAEREAKIDQLGKAIRSGISRNDAVVLLDLGLDKAEGGDVALVESGLVPLTEASEGVASRVSASDRDVVIPQVKPEEMGATETMADGTQAAE